MSRLRSVPLRYRNPFVRASWHQGLIWISQLNHALLPSRSGFSTRDA